MKIWDIGGQFQFRQNWVDYAKLSDVIIFMIDASDVRKNLYKIKCLFILMIFKNLIYAMKIF
jgi:GTPase SAR1 family protein